MSVLVVGGGFAGTAAAWSLAQRGQDVVMAYDQAGASELYSGALDRAQWTGVVDDTPLPEELERLMAELGVRVSAQSAWIGSAFGVVRSARAIDTALLDLEPLSGCVVGVLDPGRPGWNAQQLAQSFEASLWAERTGTRFTPVRLRVNEAYDLAWVSDIDVADGLAQPKIFEGLVRELRALPRDIGGVLCGPWLGLEEGLVERLRSGIERPMGETLSEPGGPAGARFARARDRLLDASGVTVVRARVRSVQRQGDVWRVQAEPGSLPGDVFAQVVLAVGGVVGGGIRFRTGEERIGGRSFALSLEAPVSLRLGGREVSLHSGSEGIDLQDVGQKALARVGISVGSGHRVVHEQGLFAVGDVVGQRPRVALEAMGAGIEAARTACGR